MNHFAVILLAISALCLVFLYFDETRTAIKWSVMRATLNGKFGISVETPRNLKNVKEKSNCSKWEEWREAYRACMAKKSTSLALGDLWQHWHDIWTVCFLKTNITNAAEQLRLVANENEDDVKMAIRSANDANGNNVTSCTVVTLGVGGDIAAEMAMLARNPDCQFYGADPIQEYGAIYSIVGTYFEIAVGAEKGVLNASVKNGPGISDYTWKAVPVVDLASFLQNYVNRSTIDHLWIDNEGPEYRILPLLERKGDLDRNGIIVCQLNIEMHWPLQYYGFDEEQFGRMVLNFAEKSDFVLMSVNPPGGHFRPFFFNAYNPYCVQRYFRDWC